MAKANVSEGPKTDVLLVEGPDDYHFLIHFLNHHGLYGQIRCQDTEGIDTLLPVLPTWLKPSNLERLGIIVDADTDLPNRWKALRNILINADYDNVPEMPQANGTIITHNVRPTVGLWLMPNNTLPGMLEDFVSMLVPEGDKLWSNAVLSVEQIPVEDRLFAPQHVIKAKIHTWLAWQEEPGTPLGQAITKRYLSADAPQAVHLVNWLRKLYNK